ncbi:hypothetical protein HDU79_011111 [Rhizoclosmatium sp. JEL0117]|nr:hypothetical protein HDU79_011111 [Rhizoclosmatium sp. JEL0117]
MKRCLDFTLPASFSFALNDGDLYDTATNGTFSKLVNFTSSDPACGGPGISSRLAKVYGHVINEKDFQLSGLITDAETPNAPRLITGVTSAFTLVPDGTGRRRDDPVDPDPTLCIVNWASDKIPTPGSYVLDNKSPICGPQAPVLVDNTEKYREKLAVVGADSFGNIVIGDKVHQTVFKYAYGVDSAAVSPIKVLSRSKFTFSVTSNATSPTDANSCVYTYVSQDIPANTQEYVLGSYTLGSLSLQNGTAINDGCITTAISTYLGQFQFTNTSQACGPTDPTSRFQRYFGGDKNVVYNALTVGSGVFNVSSGEPDSNIPHGFGRRDPGDASFHYINKDLIQNNATPSSTATFIATSSITASTIATSSVAATNIAYSSTASLSFTSSVPTSTISASTVAANSSVVSATPSTSALTNNSKSLTAVTTNSGAPAPTEVGANSIVTTITPVVAPTSSAAPNVFTAQNTYGLSAGNNIYKGDATSLVGVFSAFITAIIFGL